MRPLLVGHRAVRLSSERRKPIRIASRRLRLVSPNLDYAGDLDSVVFTYYLRALTHRLPAN